MIKENTQVLFANKQQIAVFKCPLRKLYFYQDKQLGGFSSSGLGFTNNKWKNIQRKCFY